MWKILIIDDDFQVLEGMRKSISWDSLGAQWVGEANDGQEGLERIRETRPDIIITDIYMPVMNGLEMIEQLREEDYQAEVIILSGYADFQYARQALRLHVSDYLSKPVTIDELHSVLGKVIKELEAKELQGLEQEEIRRKLMMVEPFIQKEWLKSVVTGTYEATSATGQIEIDRKSYWANRKHIVAGIELKSSTRIAEVSLIDWNLFRFALSNIIQEILSSGWAESEYIELHSHHAAIIYQIGLDVSEEDALQTIRAISAHIKDSVCEYLKLNIQIGYGSIKRNWQEISDSTEEAFLSILQQHLVVAQEEQSQHRLQGEHAIRPVKFYQELAEAIVYSNEDTALKVAADYLTQLEVMQQPNPAYLQYLCAEIVTIFAYSLYNTGIVFDELIDKHTLADEIIRIQTLDSFHHWLNEKIQLIVCGRRKNENAKHGEAVDYMVHYAHEHYAKEINLEDMAKQLYLSRNYLNQIFKKAIGETFTNYVIRVRMEKAKSLLIEGKYLIYEVAEKVGYKNVPYFSSIFKKYSGKNPSEVGKL